MAAPLLKHKFTSGKADGTDVTLVKPSNWNDDHRFETTGAGVLLGRDASGPGPVQELPLSAVFSVAMMMLWPGSVAPGGWMLCQGQSLVKDENPILFGVVGTSFGSADAAHFNIPDMRGRVPAGVDGGVGRLTTASINTPNLVGGVGGGQQAQAHTSMTVGGTVYGGTGGEALSAHVWGATSTEHGSMGTVSGGPAIGSHNHSVDIWGSTSGAQSVAVSGNMSGAAWSSLFNIVQPTILINFIIKLG